MDTESLAAGLVDRTLPKELWTHHAHLRVGLWHAMRHPPAEALALLRTRISAYNASVGGENTATSGYHESITRFYVTLIATWLASADTSRPLPELERELIGLCGDRELPLRYYTRERLYSPAARLGWVAPDLAPLPAVPPEPVPPGLAPPG